MEMWYFSFQEEEEEKGEELGPHCILSQWLGGALGHPGL